MARAGAVVFNAECFAARVYLHDDDRAGAHGRRVFRLPHQAAPAGLGNILADVFHRRHGDLFRAATSEEEDAAAGRAGAVDAVGGGATFTLTAFARARRSVIECNYGPLARTRFRMGRLVCPDAP